MPKLSDFVTVFDFASPAPSLPARRMSEELFWIIYFTLVKTLLPSEAFMKAAHEALAVGDMDISGGLLPSASNSTKSLRVSGAVGMRLLSIRGSGGGDRLRARTRERERGEALALPRLFLRVGAVGCKVYRRTIVV